MPRYALVSSEWLQKKSLRIDASFYNFSGAQEANTYLSNGKIKKISLSKLTANGQDGIFIPGRFKRIYVKNDEKGYKFIGGDVIGSHNLTISCKYLSKKFLSNARDFRLNEGSIVVTRSGTVGKVAYIGKGYTDLLGSEHMIRVIADESMVCSGYIYAFLKSRVGQALLMQNIFGSVIQHIEPENLYDMPIPVIDKTIERKIHSKIAESDSLRTESISNINRACSLTAQRLPVVDEEPRKYEVFEKTISDFDFSFAGFNCSKRVNEIKNIVLKNKYIDLNDVIDEIVAPPLFKHIYLEKDNGYPFMTGGELEKEKPKKLRYLSPVGVKKIEDYVVKKGWILIYKSGSIDGMIGSSFLVGDDLDGFCLSDHVIRLKAKQTVKDYIPWIFAFFRSVQGKILLKNLATGSAIPFIVPERIRKLKIPAPDSQGELLEVQNLVYKAEEQRIKANILEDEAISMIEKEIG